MVHWMGVSFVFACVAAAWELLRLVIPLGDVAAVPWLFLTAVILVVVAMAASHHLQIRQYRIHSSKLNAPLRVVQISDVHIGSRQGRFMARIVDRINHLKPDYVVITGDLIDSSAVEIEALKPLENLAGTTFFSVGNHERYADLPKAIAMLESLGVVPLRQTCHFAQGVQFIGIDDAEHHDHLARHLPGVGVLDDHFTILLYHRPLGWEAAIQHGVDLMLSGHTHNGQIFPFNWIVRRQFNRIRGMHRQSDCHLYVSVGTGTWGPLMRLGSLNEISCFDLLPHDH
jgi:predicted MPP superfamily phosphohydrolase